MKIGTLACILFGHNFKGREIVYEPHYLKNVEQGIAAALTHYDYHHKPTRRDFCVRCGIFDCNGLRK